ncbi:metalloregulator ArsR/SmtB family transcription factor [Nocardiopsis lambiniae]|uniref:Metalloregulator ArsR/SmtB family transcription factor n=1 Tax=Nocardiopsis lambiniae TaxID=3075539 RepID=A0ABU2MFM3_9ACTN|nr:metalloregulator ArsR/SmtB family transcription factor [Nocardiopsis sp. DSM 44743]MDT0331499.1 metalloregulator ArsR/SmtB family transcription factor [Nocardiopsis sp. DSM 44743]
MHERLEALGEAARLRIVRLLTERPLSVGVIAERAGLRQPQATKHLQRLERAGLVVSRRSANRRVYALEPEPLRELAALLTGLADTAEAHRCDRETFEAYFAAVEAETRAADRARWADERTFVFDRVLRASRATVWSHLTEPDLLARWWAPNDLTVTEVALEPRPGGRAVLAYRDAADTSGVDGTVGRAEGVVDEVAERERIVLRLSPLLPDGGTAFTGHYEFTLSDTEGGTGLGVRLRITDSAVASAEFVAGIEIGWNQSLDKLTAAVTGGASPRQDREEEPS